MTTWSAAILAGGRARRLGGVNKALLALAARPNGPSLLDRQLEMLSKVVDRTVIIANDAEAFRDSGVPVIADLHPDAGALGGLHTAVHAAGTDRILVMACDMPFVSEKLLRYVVEAGASADIAIPRTTRGYEPLCATYSRRSADPLRRLVETRQFRLSEVASIADLVIREIGSGELERFGFEDRLFFNINTPDDFARAIDLEREYRSLIG